MCTPLPLKRLSNHENQLNLNDVFCKKENNKENDKDYEFKTQNDKDHHIVLGISSFRFMLNISVTMYIIANT